MDIYLEFISNHGILFIALLIVLILLAQTVFSDLTRKHKLISPSAAINLINREDAVIIDTRNEGEFNGGHINDAVLIPLPEIKDNTDKFNKYEGRPILFYCKTGMRSDEACKILVKQGFTDLYTLSGGVQAWEDAKMPLVKK